ncbi:uncharacterized protein TNCV_3636581 [Trichonephila clavipes]|nr:uncharacterized protein TNCV_3636581 [Trichonephila clavipes]
MRRVSAKFMPRFLTEDQQFQRLATSSDLFQSERDDPEFMKLIITGDESCVYGYDPETKQQSSQWKTPVSPRPKKARQVRSKIKVMLIVFLMQMELFIMSTLPRTRTSQSLSSRNVSRTGNIIGPSVLLPMEHISKEIDSKPVYVCMFLHNKFSLDTF